MSCRDRETLARYWIGPHEIGEGEEVPARSIGWRAFSKIRERPRAI